MSQENRSQNVTINDNVAKVLLPVDWKTLLEMILDFLQTPTIKYHIAFNQIFFYDNETGDRDNRPSSMALALGEILTFSRIQKEPNCWQKLLPTMESSETLVSWRNLHKATEEIEKLRDLSSSTASTSGLPIPTNGPIPNQINKTIPLTYFFDRSTNTLMTSDTLPLSPLLTWQWCLDLLLAAEYLQYNDVALKWLDMADIRVSSSGRLVITNLTGAEVIDGRTNKLEQFKTKLIDFMSSDIDKSTDELHHKAKFKIDEEPKSDPEKVKDNSSEMKHVKQDEVEVIHGDEIFSEEQTGKIRKQEKKNPMKGKKKVRIPINVLNITAPEIIFGGSPSHHSTMYVIGMIASWILTGNPLIKVS